MLIIADNLHIVRSDIARAVEQMDPAPIQRLVRHCIQAGAQAIDINPGPLSRQAETRMAFIVETVQAVTDLPLMLDTTNPAAMAAGLRACRNPAIINGFSLEPVKIEGMLPLAKQFDADIIGYLLHSDSRVPIEQDEMMGLAVDLFAVYTGAGLSPERLIVDPVITPLSWQDGVRHNQAVLALVRNLADLLGAPVRTIAGVSNLASGRIPVERKTALEQAFVPMLAAAGLDMALMNVQHGATVATINLCNGLLGQGVFAWASPDGAPD